MSRVNNPKNKALLQAKIEIYNRLWRVMGTVDSDKKREPLIFKELAKIREEINEEL